MSMPRQHTKFVYAPEWSFGFVVAAMLQGPYSEHLYDPAGQKTWVDIIQDFQKTKQLLVVDKKLLKDNKANLAWAAANSINIISDPGPPQGTGGNTGGGGAPSPGGPIPSGPTAKMYDATGGTLSSIPRDAQAVASYVDNYGGYNEAVKMFGNRMPVVSISVTPGNNVKAHIYDVEPGGKSVSETVNAIASGLTKGAYGGASDLHAIQSALSAKGIQRSQYKLWIASWPGSGANVTSGYDAHQYASVNAYDTSMALTSFFT